MLRQPCWGGYNALNRISKIRAFMKHSYKHPVDKAIAVTLLVVVVAALLPCVGWAESTDRDKPMNAEADALRYDDLKQTSVFSGNVVITKGSTIIRGSQVSVKQDPEGYQQAVVLSQPGKLAFYRKKRDGLDEYIEGEGERIEYDSRQDVVKFINKAVMRRYNGAVLADETSGSQISYDNKTDVFAVDGGPQNRSATNPSGRVRALLSPRIIPSAPTAPLAPPAALRSSPSLSVDKK